MTHRSGTSRSRSFPDNRADYSRLRAAVARRLMGKPVVRALEPVTRRRVRHIGLVVRTDHAAFSAETRAEMFWRIYERPEVKFLRWYLPERHTRSKSNVAALTR